MKQTHFHFSKNWTHRWSHGGSLRNLRRGRSSRPLSSRDPVHVVLKAQKLKIKGGFRTYRRYFLILHLVQKYSHRFFVKVEQISIQGDHIHLLIRASRRRGFQSYFRVLSGQIAQQFEKRSLVTDTPAHSPQLRKGLWMHRPFTRVVRGWKAYRTVRDYIQLNEKEALGDIPYQKDRLQGLSEQDRKALWEWG